MTPPLYITHCTAPCIPACRAQGTFALLNGKSKVLLGVNCPAHAESLAKIRGGDGSFDYSIQSLLLTDEQHAIAIKDQSVTLTYLNEGDGTFSGPYTNVPSMIKLESKVIQTRLDAAVKELK